MSSPDLTSDIAHFLQDNLVTYLKGATDEELCTFIETLFPHISPVGVNRVFPIVAEVIQPDQDLQNYLDYEEIVEVSLNPLRQPNPEKEGTNGD